MLLAQQLYEAYWTAMDWTDVNEERVLAWPSHAPSERAAWIAAAKVITESPLIDRQRQRIADAVAVRADAFAKSRVMDETTWARLNLEVLREKNILTGMLLMVDSGFLKPGDA